MSKAVPAGVYMALSRELLLKRSYFFFWGFVVGHLPGFCWCIEASVAVVGEFHTAVWMGRSCVTDPALESS